MGAWSKTLLGKDVSVERAFLPIQHAIVRLGYELVEIKNGKRLKFRHRGQSAFAWDNHRHAHNAMLNFRAKTRGVFSKEHYLEVEITFYDWDMTVSEAAAKAWQEIADKLQVMLSDPATFLPLQAPGQPQPPVQAAPDLPATKPAPRPLDPTPVAVVDEAPASLPVASLPRFALPVGTPVHVQWSDGRLYPAVVESWDSDGANVLFAHGGRETVPLTSLIMRAVPQPPTSVVQNHIVERQVVVVRCRFCAQLSPVDWNACQHCGAVKFG